MSRQRVIQALLLSVAAIVAVGVAGWCAIVYDTKIISRDTSVVVPPHAHGRLLSRLMLPDGSRLERAAFASLIRYCRIWRYTLPGLPRNTRCAIYYGRYEVRGPASPLELLRQLSAGPLIARVVIPEGFDLRKTSRVLAKAGVCSVSDFMAFALDPKRASAMTHLELPSLEGYLAPDTYIFAQATPAEIVVRRMVGRRFASLPHETYTRSQELGMSLNQVLVLASMIEKEAGLNDREHVSAVFHNRLASNWKLESCATAIYAAGDDFHGVLTKHELESQSSFNTYQHFGLPPSPICTPGNQAIHAALYPEPSNDFFFVSRNDGTHVFSKTRSEHEHWACIYQTVDCPKPANRTTNSASTELNVPAPKHNAG